MRRGGRLFLLLGLIIAALGAFLAYYFFSLPGGSQFGGTGGQIVPPTTVPRRSVVIARIDIPANTVLTDTETYLTTRDIPESEYNTSLFTTIGEVQGKLALRQLTVDAPIRQSDVVDPGLSFQIPPPQAGQPALKAFVVQVNNLTGVADQVRPGDSVDILTSIDITQVFIRPGVNDQGTPTLSEQERTERSTKTLVQNVQVLQVRRPRTDAAGTPTPGRAATPGTTETDEQGRPLPAGPNTPADGQAPDVYVPGSWLLLLAVTDQQAEAIKFAQEQGATPLTLVLRGRGDTAVENTFGATLDILVSRFGLPVPGLLPPAQVSTGLTTQAPITTPVQPTSTPTP